MKVCFVTANFPPEAAGGTEQVVVALARELRARGVQVAAISGSDVVHQGDDSCSEVFEGVPVLRVFARAAEFGHTDFVRPRLLAQVRQWLLEQQPDVVHIHSFSGLGLGITGVCRELGLPVVVTFHDLWVTCARFFRLPQGSAECPTDTDRTSCVTCIAATLPMDEGLIRQGLLQRDELVVAELAAANVFTAPSQTAACAVASSLSFAGAIEVVPHGLLREVPAEHATQQSVAGPLRVGTFGGLVPEKGLRELVEACVAVVASGHPCELHLSGRWYDLEFAGQLRELARNGGLDLVEHGRYGAEDRHPARDLDLAVFPSKCQETYGLGVDEALAHGVPVVTSDCGAFAERSMIPGVVVTKLDALACVLGELVSSYERLSELREAISRPLPTIAISAQRHFDIYQSLR